MRRLLLISLLLSLLSGCFPLVATGVGAGALMAGDRRTSGAYIEDQGIELKAQDLIGKNFKDTHINVTSYNRNVLLTGEAPTQAAKDGIEQITRGVTNVRSITNEIAVSGPSSLGSRSNDTLLTTKVKTRLLGNDKIPADVIKVVTENGVVYLMGLVKHSEAESAIDVASTTGGVQKVVKVFEYLD